VRCSMRAEDTSEAHGVALHLRVRGPFAWRGLLLQLNVAGYGVAARGEGSSTSVYV
jgi:hypothetical protein